MKTEIKVAIYEDNKALRESLSLLVQKSEGLLFSGAYPDCRQILRNCKENPPKVILMDIDMPYLSGIEATRLVKDAYPEIEVMMLTVFEDNNKIFDALRAGATGYLLKKASAIQITKSILELSEGGSPMSSEIARKVLLFFNSYHKQQNSYTLSEREMDVLKRLVSGDSYKMIADNCHISIGTVRTHINAIYHKLAVNSKSEAIIKAIKERLI